MAARATKKMGSALQWPKSTVSQTRQAAGDPLTKWINGGGFSSWPGLPKAMAAMVSFVINLFIPWKWPCSPFRWWFFHEPCSPFTVTILPHETCTFSTPKLSPNHNWHLPNLKLSFSPTNMVIFAPKTHLFPWFSPCFPLVFPLLSLGFPLISIDLPPISMAFPLTCLLISLDKTPWFLSFSPGFLRVNPWWIPASIWRGAGVRLDRRGRDPVAAAAPLDGALRQLLRRSGSGVGHFFF